MGVGALMPTVKTAHLPNGLTLPYVEQGQGSGVPVVLLHAYADSWRSFDRVLSYLPSWVHAFAVTQRGHGMPTDPPAATGSGISRRTWRRSWTLSHWNGRCWLRARAQASRCSVSPSPHPHRTLGIVLTGAPWSLRDNPAADEFFDAVSALSDPVDPVFVRDFVHATASGAIPPAFLEMMTIETASRPPASGRQRSRAFSRQTPPPAPRRSRHRR